MSVLFASALALFAAAEAPAPAVFVWHGSADEALVLEKKASASMDDTDPGEEAPPVAPAVKKGTAYRTVDLSAVSAEATTSGDGKIGESGCGAMPRPIVPFDKVPPSDAPYVLVSGTWPAKPASVTTESAASAAYEAIVAPEMEVNGIKGAKIVSGTAVKTDFDGDGTEDLIFTATNVPADAEIAKIGNYSILAVQLSKKEGKKLVPLLVQTVDEGNEEMVEGTLAPPTIVAVADIDGDGKMELVTLGIGYEEHFVDVWSIADDGTPTITYQAWCGV